MLSPLWSCTDALLSYLLWLQTCRVSWFSWFSAGLTQWSSAGWWIMSISFGRGETMFSKRICRFLRPSPSWREFLEFLDQNLIFFMGRSWNYPVGLPNVSKLIRIGLGREWVHIILYPVMFCVFIFVHFSCKFLLDMSWSYNSTCSRRKCCDQAGASIIHEKNQHRWQHFSQLLNLPFNSSSQNSRNPLSSGVIRLHRHLFTSHMFKNMQRCVYLVLWRSDRSWVTHLNPHMSSGRKKLLIDDWMGFYYSAPERLMLIYSYK